MFKLMRKSDYEAPRMDVVELRNQTALLAGSTTGSVNDREDYTPGGDPFNPVP